MLRVLSVLWMSTYWIALLSDKNPMFFLGGLIVGGVLYIGDCIEHQTEQIKAVKPKKKDTF